MSKVAPIIKIEFAPGQIKDDSPTQAEGGVIDSRGVRWSQGKAQSRGGWLRLLSSTFLGTCRGAWAWADLGGTRTLMFGADNRLYSVRGTTLTDISPSFVFEGYILTAAGAINTTPFSVVTGSPTVIVTHADHGLVVGQSITNTATTSPVGNIAVTGTFTVASIISADQYTFTGANNANATTTGGGRTFARYAPYTTAYSVPTIWFVDNFGEDGLALPSGGALFSYQPATSYPQLIYNGTFAAGSDGWAFDTGWSIGAGVATGVAGVQSNLSQNIKNSVKPGRAFRFLTNVVTTTGGALTVFIDNTVVFATTTFATGSSSIQGLIFMPAEATNLIIQKNAAWAGTVDNVSLVLEDAAAVQEAPNRSAAMFVTQEGAVALLGTIGVDDVYDPMMVRTSSIKDKTTWLPSAVASAGFDRQAAGSKLVSGLKVRSENVIFTDTSIISMRATGSNTEPYAFFLISSNCGLMAPHAAISTGGGAVIWLANTGKFWIYDGQSAREIDSRIQRDVFNHIDAGQQIKIAAFVNSTFSEVGFLYPDSRDTGTECSREAVLAYTENFFYSDPMARSYWLDRGVFDYPLSFDFNGLIQQQEFGTSADSSALDTYLLSAVTDIGDGNMLLRMHRFIPDFAYQTANLTLRIYGRNRPRDTMVLMGTYTITPTTKTIDFRHTARQVQFELEGSSTDMSWRAGSWAVEIMETGQSR